MGGYYPFESIFNPSIKGVTPIDKFFLFMFILFIIELILQEKRKEKLEREALIKECRDLGIRIENEPDYINKVVEAKLKKIYPKMRIMFKCDGVICFKTRMFKKEILFGSHLGELRDWLEDRQLRKKPIQVTDENDKVISNNK